MGENIFFQSRKLPANPKYIKLYNNIAVASDVDFVSHDVIHYVFNNINKTDKGRFQSYLDYIEIMDNVFISSGSVTIPNVRIGSNVIVAAGSIVTKNIPKGVIVGQIPAIGSFDDFCKKCLDKNRITKEPDRIKRVVSE